MASRNHDFKWAVLNLVDCFGEADKGLMMDLIADRIPAVRDKAGYLARTLRQLEKKRLLDRAHHGIYRTAPGWYRRGLDNASFLIIAISEFLRRQPGKIAKADDIHQALGNRCLAGRKRGASHRQITLVLKDHFRRLERGWWGVDADADLLRRALEPSPSE